MSLEALSCVSTPIAGFEPVRGMPLKEIRLEFVPRRDGELLKSLSTLEKINDLPAPDFWKKHGGPDVAAGLVGHWKLDEKGGATAVDASGHNHTARLEGAPAWVPAQVGGGLRFSGDDAILELPNSPVLDVLQNESYTAAAWFKPEALPAKNDPRDPEYAILLKPGFNAGLKYAPPGMCGMEHWLTGDSNVGLYSPAGDSAPGRFHHLVGVVDKAAGVTQIYVNGALQGTRKWAAGTTSRDYAKATWRIGIMLPRASVSRWSTRGIIDDARLYNRALGAPEVEALHKAGAAGREP